MQRIHSGKAPGARRVRRELAKRIQAALRQADKGSNTAAKSKDRQEVTKIGGRRIPQSRRRPRHSKPNGVKGLPREVLESMLGLLNGQPQAEVQPLQAPQADSLTTIRKAAVALNLLLASYLCVSNLLDTEEKPPVSLLGMVVDKVCDVGGSIMWSLTTHTLATIGGAIFNTAQTQGKSALELTRDDFNSIYDLLAKNVELAVDTVGGSSCAALGALMFGQVAGAISDAAVGTARLFMQPK